MTRSSRPKKRANRSEKSCRLRSRMLCNKSKMRSGRSNKALKSRLMRTRMEKRRQKIKTLVAIKQLKIQRRSPQKNKIPVKSKMITATTTQNLTKVTKATLLFAMSHLKSNRSQKILSSAKNTSMRRPPRLKKSETTIIKS